MLGETSSQTIEPSDETVTKSAVVNTDVIPSISRIFEIPAGASSIDVWVAGPPTGLPTVNFMARGFGVGSTEMLKADPRLRTGNGSPAC